MDTNDPLIVDLFQHVTRLETGRQHLNSNEELRVLARQLLMFCVKNTSALRKALRKPVKPRSTWGDVKRLGLAASARGETTFDPGQPCRNGHASWRHVFKDHYPCMECEIIRKKRQSQHSMKWTRKNMDKHAVYMKRYKERYPEKYRENYMRQCERKKADRAAAKLARTQSQV